jgi:hypothetical protein
MTDLVTRTKDVLRTNAPRWGELAGIDFELFARRPLPTEWSAFECLGHAMDTEALFGVRVRAIRDGVPTIKSFDPDTEGTKLTNEMEPARLVARHAALRAESLALLETVTEADLDRTSVHSELGVVSMRELLNEWSAHELMHLVQAERAIMQAFIPGSGPWRDAFADHDVEVRKALT